MPNIFNILTRETRCVCCYRVRPVGWLRRACADCRRNAQCGEVNCREVEDRFEDGESMLLSEYAAWRKLRRMGLNLPAGNPMYREAAMRRELANLALEGSCSGLALSIAYPRQGDVVRGAYAMVERDYDPDELAEHCPACGVAMAATVDAPGAGLVGHICSECKTIWLLSAAERTVREINRELAAAEYALGVQMPGKELRNGA